jgi:dihydrodipicolinate synthase/N-acetylneuraminate lyase
MEQRSHPQTARIKGFFAPIPAVFDGQGELDLVAIEKLVDFYLAARVHGFFLFGSLGMGPACRDDQRKAATELIVKRVAHKVPVIVQVGTVDPYSSCDLAQHAATTGADAIGIVGPYYYNNRTEYELIEHYKSIDAAAGLPIVLYNNPNYSGYPCPPAMMARIREAIPNVFGAKLADGTVGQAMHYLRVLSNEFATFVPINVVVPGMLVGIRGTIAAGPIAVVPEIGVQMVEAIWAGKLELALQLQVLMIQHYDRMTHFHSYGRAEYREGFKLRGLPIKEYPRWPTKSLTAEDLKLYESLLNRVFDEVAELTRRSAAA